MKYGSNIKKHWLLELERVYKRSYEDKKLGNWLGAELNDDYAEMLEWRISQYNDGGKLIEGVKAKVYCDIRER